jgi:hypothetical protein
MAKIKINSLPAGFKLVNGKIEEDQMMRDGGRVTGDQAGYGLVTLPQEYYNNANMNTTRDESVRYSLSSVPRDKANIEAEGGETVLTDLNDDNQFGLYNITGPRHSKGGVPMYLPEQSFIYSDTDKMRFNQEEMAEYGIESKSKMTPAQISKRYDLNKYYGTMKDQFADEITARSSELMLKKNMMGLSKLAFGQELKKKFEDGVPLAAHPYLVSIGEDPIEFTAKVENITKKQAQMKAFAALDPEQQQQLLQLQEMMAQVDGQQPQQEEQPFEDPSMQDPNMQDLSMADEDVMAMGDPNEGMARYGREIGMYQDGKEKLVNPLPKDHPNYAKAQEMIDSGKFAVTKGAIVDGKQQYNFKKIETEDPQFKAEKEAQLAKERIAGQNQMGIGSVSIYNDELTDQERAIQENSKGIYQYGRLSQGNRPELQNKTGSAFGSEDIKTPESKADFMDRWGDVVATISGFDYDKEPDDPQWGEFQKKAEETRKKEHIAAFGSDKGYIPYWKEKGSKGYVSGQAFDSKLGLHTYNAPRFKLGEVEPGDATFSVDVPPDPRDPLQAPGVQNYKQPEGQWWAQDINNLNALSLVDDNLYLPWAPDMNPAKIDYVLDDWRGAANANSAAANTMANALGAVGGPQAVANSNIQGQAMDANAQAINRVNTNNVGIMNQVAPMQAQLNMKVDEINQGRNMNVYDNTQKTLQNADNFKNWKIGKEAELFNTALTNRANTYNLNSTYDYYAIDPTTGGPIYYKNGKALQKAPVTDQASLKKAYFDNVAEYAKNIGRTPSEKELEGYFKYIGGINNTPDISNAQLEMKTRGNPQGYVQGKSGKEIKRMIVPFYTGKMGS